MTRPTANDRFKDSFGTWSWGSLAVAVLVHFLIFALWPDLEAADLAYSPAEIETIDLPPEVEIPPPPDQIVRPATPVVSDVVVDTDVTIAPTTFKDNPIENLSAPSTQAGEDISQAPRFTPMDVRPRIKNVEQVRRALERFYPPNLRDAGVGGTVNVHFYIDENGTVRNSLVNVSSGFDALDRAALRVAELAEFTPALNRDQRVAVWIQLDLVFSSR